MTPWKTKSGHTLLSLAVSNPSAANICSSETINRRRRRSKRSTVTPAIGDARNDGSENETNASDTRNSLSVASLIIPVTATKENQSPMKETTWAMNSQRRSRLARNSLITVTA